MNIHSLQGDPTSGKKESNPFSSKHFSRSLSQLPLPKMTRHQRFSEDGWVGYSPILQNFTSIESPKCFLGVMLVLTECTKSFQCTMPRIIFTLTSLLAPVYATFSTQRFGATGRLYLVNSYVPFGDFFPLQTVLQPNLGLIS